MRLTYEQIRDIFFHGNNQEIIVKALEEKYKISLTKPKPGRCMQCGKVVSASSWLCPDNEYQCIVDFFNNNLEILVEGITHAP